METSQPTTTKKIKNKEAIAYEGSTGHLVLPGTPVDNLKPAIKPI